MRTHHIPSSFLDTETVVYHYPPTQDSNKVVLVLKGLYGSHDPKKVGENASWDNNLARLLQDAYHVIFVRTGRKEGEDKQAQFEGKTFTQECVDIETAIMYCEEKVFPAHMQWGAVASSFGGTVLLGVPKLFSSFKTIIFVGSGCGKSTTTTKPLLKTLIKTGMLLKTIADFKGNFFFLRGGQDIVVPLESQKKIYESAVHATCRGWIEFSDLNHELMKSSGSGSDIPQQAAQLLRAFF